MNLADLFVRAARSAPEDPALITPGGRWSYAELDELSNALAHELVRIGLTTGDRVATFSGNRAEVVMYEFACYKSGLPRVPVNSRLSAGELAHILRNSGAVAVIVDADHEATAREIVDQVPDLRYVIALSDDRAQRWPTPVQRFEHAALAATDDRSPVRVDVAGESPAVLHFTSGSTGTLKAAVQTVGNRTEMLTKIHSSPDLRIGPGERCLYVAPITHASGKFLLGALSAGGCGVVLDGFDVKTWFQAVEEESVTVAFVVPTILNRLVDDDLARTADVRSLRRILYGAAPMSPARLRAAAEIFGCDFVQAYGCGETTGVVLVLDSNDHRAALAGDVELLSSCGRAVFNTDVRVLRENGTACDAGELGEIAIRGRDVVTEYWNEPELTAENFRDGWFWTGDIGRVRQDGYFFLVDRRKDMIVSGGFNVYAVEVESALLQHPAVAQVAVVGVPDRTWGEAVKAVVVLRDGTDLTEQDLISFCAERLASMKKPRSVDFVDDLPVNPNGKLDRRAVRSRYWAAEERKVG